MKGVVMVASGAHRRLVSLVTVAGCLTLAGGVVTRSQQVSAGLRGTVTSAMGEPLGGADIEARDLATGVSRLTATDQHGKFAFPVLPAGTYSLRVTLRGFSPSEQRLTLRINEMPHLSVALRVAGQPQAETAAEGVVRVFEWTAPDRASFEDWLKERRDAGLALMQVTPLSRKNASLVVFEERAGQNPGPTTVVQVDGELTATVLAHEVAAQPGKSLVGVHRTNGASLLVFK